ncbi:MAG: dTDP-4-dehydrorhamnose 3,5-epimerase [Parachlamydiaceae bacterium]
MKFTPTPLEGAYLIDLEVKEDERGFFARLFCEKEFATHGLKPSFVQSNNSLSKHKGTLRGLHYQLAPMEEAKLVRCVQGVCYDTILDLRQHSKTFGQSFGAILSTENRRMMYVPPGFAHGFLTLANDTELIYFVSEYYSPELERGIRWNDPSFSIYWPIAPIVISERDRLHPDYSPLQPQRNQ